ncbi:MAG: glycosyltransferase [Pyrinomonadaceae bacterium]|nr:glycosyltransferase [Pyrinomonadaceae bacterium]
MTVNLLLIFAWLGVAAWLVFSVVVLRRSALQKKLAPLPGESEVVAGDTPLVSILVPARNEEHRALKACLRSLLAQDYKHIEVIAVDDCSTDATGAILHDAAKTNERLRVIDGIEPPPPWLGKPHALQQAFEASGGEWILAIDADMIFAKEAVRTSLTHSLAHNYDALTLIPHVECLSFWERVFMPTCWGVMMTATMPLHRVNDPRRKNALGIGGFFLMKREWLERIGGFHSVRVEVLEDVRLAELLKASGARLRIERAPQLARTRMLTNFGEMWHGFTKNMFAAMNFSLPLAILGAFSIFAFAVLPFIVALVCLVMIAAGGPEKWMSLFVPAFIVWLIQVVAVARVNREWGVPIIYALTVPLNYALFAAILLNSARRIVTGKGVAWKGRTLYERTGGHSAQQRQPDITKSRGQ